MKDAPSDSFDLFLAFIKTGFLYQLIVSHLILKPKRYLTIIKILRYKSLFAIFNEFHLFSIWKIDDKPVFFLQITFINVLQVEIWNILDPLHLMLINILQVSYRWFYP